MTLDWKLWYDGDKTFDSSQGEPNDTPGEGLVIAGYPDKRVGTILMQGWDWYYWWIPDRQWWGSDIYGMLGRLRRRHPIQAVTEGVNVSNKEFSRLLTLAADDPGLPTKSGLHKIEKQSGGFIVRWWKEYSQ